jgi:hypothetical protein
VQPAPHPTPPAPVSQADTALNPKNVTLNQLRAKGFEMSQGVQAAKAKVEEAKATGNAQAIQQAEAECTNRMAMLSKFMEFARAVTRMWGMQATQNSGNPIASGSTQHPQLSGVAPPSQSMSDNIPSTVVSPNTIPVQNVDNLAAQIRNAQAKTLVLNQQSTPSTASRAFTGPTQVLPTTNLPMVQSQTPSTINHNPAIVAQMQKMIEGQGTAGRNQHHITGNNMSIGAGQHNSALMQGNAMPRAMPVGPTPGQIPPRAGEPSATNPSPTAIWRGALTWRGTESDNSNKPKVGQCTVVASILPVNTQNP